MANHFDQAARYAVRHLDAVEFFRWVLEDANFATAWRWHKWLDTQAVPFPGEPDRRCDTVAAFERVAGDHPPLAVIIEFMSRTRLVSLRRLAQYGFQVAEDCPYQTDPRVEYDFIGVVVNLTGGAQGGTLTIAPPDVGNLGLLGSFGARTLAQRDAEAQLTDIAGGKQGRSILVWLPLMLGANTADFVRRWRTEVERVEDARKRGIIVGLALVFAELADRRAVWQRGVEGMNVERSQVVTEWEQRGELRGRKASLLDVLETKWGQNIPEDVLQAVETQEDVTTIKEWTAAAVTSGSLDDFRSKMVRRPG
jgi:hypothetical protein